MVARKAGIGCVEKLGRLYGLQDWGRVCAKSILLMENTASLKQVFFPKAPAKGFSLSTAAYFIFLNLFLLLHLPHSLFLSFSYFIFPTLSS